MKTKFASSLLRLEIQPSGPLGAGHDSKSWELKTEAKNRSDGSPYLSLFYISYCVLCTGVPAKMKAYSAAVSLLQLSLVVALSTEAILPSARTTHNASITKISTSAVTASYMTIAVTNLYGTQLSLSLGVDAHFPTPLNNPQPTVLPNSASTQFVYPTGWAGRIAVGETTSTGNSLIEGSYTNGPFIDVSYVDGYSVPITCSCDGVPVTGCNIDLFNQPGIKCDDELEGHICNNTIRVSRPGGPPIQFFAACAGAAYTFSEDDKAVQSCSGLISCCIGTSCKAPSRQPGEARTVPTCATS